jgi:hypothetical protein
MTIENMKFEYCRKSCIQAAKDAALDLDVGHYESYPVPSNSEWDDCLQEAEEINEDGIENAYDCMGRWELRLCKRGCADDLYIAYRRHWRLILDLESMMKLISQNAEIDEAAQTSSKSGAQSTAMDKSLLIEACERYLKSVGYYPK